MNAAIVTTELATFLEDLKSADLVGISFLAPNLGLRLEFTFGPEAGHVAFEFYRLVNLVLSQPINSDDEDWCFWVGEVELKPVAVNNHADLSAEPYYFENSSLTYNSTLFNFRLLGDICIDLVCQEYKIVGMEILV
ncbi:MAG TPA: hypothetical protein IGS52_19670 [Oscillatoriaceae cyanobacterium M33_DOE_052]|uniref:Uncharacterized protein n=1 Tax=Planktothricoides sp. SpSt-374 TaxID=2282167 RepID=A0A7C3ZTH7_9CYAN|nr:hypothetical protein [Oscillatoriaceae cyanobacterium M33_DOE_052]